MPSQIGGLAKLISEVDLLSQSECLESVQIGTGLGLFNE